MVFAFGLALVALPLVIARPRPTIEANLDPSGLDHESPGIRIVRLDRHVASVDGSAPSSRDETQNLTVRDFDWCTRIVEDIAKAEIGLQVGFGFENKNVMNCLKSVPLDIDAAKATLESVRRSLQFYSQLSLLKTRPYDDVDLTQELNDIETGLTIDMTQIDFESSLSTTLAKAQDGHLGWKGMLSNGLFEHQRDRSLALVSVVTTQKAPQVYTLVDALRGVDNPVIKINDEPVSTVLLREGNRRGFTDDDAAWNKAMAKIKGWDSSGRMNNYGGFIHPIDDPGEQTKLTFQDGKVVTKDNLCVPFLSQEYKDSWARAANRDGMYDTFVRDAGATGPLHTRDLAAADADNNTYATRLATPAIRVKRRRARNSESLNTRATIQPQYIEPEGASKRDEIELAIYVYKDRYQQDYGIIRIGGIDGTNTDVARGYIAVLKAFLKRAQQKELGKLILDLRDFPGGSSLLGAQTFKYIFPSIDPKAISRFRAAPAADIIGSVYQDSPDGLAKPGPFNVFTLQRMRDLDLKPFADWDAVFKGATDADGDPVSNLFRLEYDWFDNEVFSSDSTSNRWNRDNTVVLTDGVCESVCATLVEKFTQDAKLRSFVIGGQPFLRSTSSIGPAFTGEMALVGGTKGTQYLHMEYLERQSKAIYSFAAAKGPVPDILPFKPPIRSVVESTYVNWSVLLRDPGSAKSESTYERYDVADCHLFYTAEMIADDRVIWAQVYDIAFGKRGGRFQYDKCLGNPVKSQR